MRDRYVRDGINMFFFYLDGNHSKHVDYNFPQKSTNVQVSHVKMEARAETL